jgi:hypothetical protein
MRILAADYAHPSQASRVQIAVFEQQAGSYLVTEQRRGASSVFSTLGVFDDRDSALKAAAARGLELIGQRYEHAVTA